MLEFKFDKTRWYEDSDGLWVAQRLYEEQPSVFRKRAMAVKKFVGEFKGKIQEALFKTYREHRSNDANAYAWVLMTRIAEKLTAEAQGETAYTKDDIYLIMLKRYGQGGIVKVRNDDVDKFVRTWKYCEEHEKLFDENAAYYRFWVGSSNYNTEEMSLFINGIISECKTLGIETRPQEEVDAMLSYWEAQAA